MCDVATDSLQSLWPVPTPRLALAMQHTRTAWPLLSHLLNIQAAGPQQQQHMTQHSISSATHILTVLMRMSSAFVNAAPAQQVHIIVTAEWNLRRSLVLLHMQTATKA